MKAPNNKQQQFVDWFRNSSPYIHSHRKRTFVILFGGEAVQSDSFAHLINDFALLNSLGVRLVLVHGARPQIEQQIQSLGLTSDYAQDLRVTDDTLLPAVEQAVGQVRVNIEAQLSMGLVNTPMSGAKLRVVSGNYVNARPYGVRNGIDFCHTGEVRKIDTQAIKDQLALGNIVLLSPIGYSLTGEAFNLRAEDIATETAIELQADKLIIMMTSKGVVDADDNLVAQLDLHSALDALDTLQLNDEIHTHLNSAVHAVNNGVSRVHLISHQTDGSLLLELYSRDGTGTMISAEQYEGLRQATIDDVGGILELIRPLEQQNILAKRSREQLELEIERFFVAERDGMIVACAALYAYPDEKVGELACLAVHADYRRDGRGDSLLKLIEKKAQQSGLKHLFILTTHTAHWFIERGFLEQGLDELPVQRKQLYNLQRNSKVFIKRLV